jgi:hypothetical protein
MSLKRGPPRVSPVFPQRLYGNRSDKKYQVLLAVPARLELATFGLGNRCSIRLSYGTKLLIDEGILPRSCTNKGLLLPKMLPQTSTSCVRGPFWCFAKPGQAGLPRRLALSR